MAEGDHTFSWYLTNFFRGDGSGRYYIDDNNLFRYQPDHDNLVTLGISDTKPSVGNLRPLLELTKTYYLDPNWMNNPRDDIEMTLHYLLSNIIADPIINPGIIRLYLEYDEKYCIPIVKNPSCPENILLNFINKSGTIDDPTNSNEGEELTCFIMMNKALSPELVDLCVRKTNKASNQKNGILNPNISRDTLEYLVVNGLSNSVKALSARHLSGSQAAQTVETVRSRRIQK